MPIYEYVCEACGRIIECMQRMGDPAPASCPECGDTRLARLVSRTTFQLKGGGWYSDLYASRKQKAEPAGGAEKPAVPPAAASSASAPDSGTSPAKTGGGGSGPGSGPTSGG